MILLSLHCYLAKYVPAIHTLNYHARQGSNSIYYSLAGPMQATFLFTTDIVNALGLYHELTELWFDLEIKLLSQNVPTT